MIKKIKEKLVNIGRWIKKKAKRIALIIATFIVGTGILALSITVLNVHSHPQEGDLWRVSFETGGIGNLTITPDDQNTIDDMDFISLKCGNEERTPQILENDVIYYPRWFCREKGEITHIINVARDHKLKFQFGRQVEYAYNSPDSLTVQPSDKDARIMKYYPTTNDNSLYLTVRCYPGDIAQERSPIYFDASALPEDAVISSATLYLYYYFYAAADPAGKTIWAYKLTRDDWVELQATWTIYKTGSNWTTPGGDYVTSSPAGGSAVVPAGYGWMEWNVKAIVEDAVANVSEHVNILLRLATEDSANSTTQFYSNTGSPGDTTLRPKLVIEYSVEAERRMMIIE